MICVVGKEKAVIGFSLAGIKKRYKSLNDIKDEKIIIIESETAQKEKDIIGRIKKDRIVIELPSESGNTGDDESRLLKRIAGISN